MSKQRILIVFPELGFYGESKDAIYNKMARSQPVPKRRTGKDTVVRAIMSKRLNARNKDCERGYIGMLHAYLARGHKFTQANICLDDEVHLSALDYVGQPDCAEVLISGEEPEPSYRQLIAPTGMNNTTTSDVAETPSGIVVAIMPDGVVFEGATIDVVAAAKAYNQ